MVYIRKRKSVRSTRRSTKSAMKRKVSIKKLTRSVNKLRKAPELKKTQIDGPSAINTAWNTLNPVTQIINTLARGNNQNQRIGHVVTAKSILINLDVYPIITTSLQTVHQWFRVMVVRVHEFNGDNVNLQMDKYFTTNFPVVTSLPRVDINPKDNISVLYDKTFEFHNTISQAIMRKVVKIKINCNNCKVQYNGGTAGNLGDIDRNAYVLWVFTDTPNSLGNGAVYWSSRFTFTDQ